jgi:acyl-CoA dehydrogenase
VWERAGEAGYLCPWLSAEEGGPGGDFLHSVVVSEELGRAYETGFAMPLHSDVVAPYVAAYGSAEQKRRYLPGFVSGKVITAIALTEPGAGSDLSGITTSAAAAEGGGYVLTGVKTFVTNGVLSDVVLLAAKTNPDPKFAHKSLSLFLVPKDTPGLSCGKKLRKVGLASQDTAELFFEGCHLGRDALLGEEGAGFRMLSEKLAQERLVVAIGAQAMAARVLEDTIEYTKQRRAFGRSISSFQNTQFLLAECATKLAVGQAFLDHLIARHRAGESLVAECSMAKYWQTETLCQVVDTCLQFFGGYGYMLEQPIASAYVDARVQRIYAGPNEVMKSMIAKALGL